MSYRLIVLLLICVSRRCTAVIVPPAGVCTAGENCTDDVFDLTKSHVGNFSIILQPGLHEIKGFHIISDLQNLTIAGETREGTTLSCSQGAGLAFLNTSMTLANFVIKNCGFTNESIESAFDFIYNQLVTTFFASRPLTIGVLLGVCHDVILENVTIRDTNGVGLLSYNTMHSFKLNSVHVMNNTAPECVRDIGTLLQLPNSTESLFTNVGGGAVLIYEGFDNKTQTRLDVDVDVTNCIFQDNLNCALGGYFAAYRRFLPLLRGNVSGYPGAGLSVLLTQTDFAVQVDITKSNFTHNNARFGSGLHIETYQGVNRSTINVIDSFFKNNGEKFLTRFQNHSSIHGGGGVVIFADVLKTDRVKVDQRLKASTHNVTFKSCIFAENYGLVGGAIRLYHSHVSQAYMKLTVDSCTLTNNTGIVGSAIAITENSGSYSDALTTLVLSDTVITKNEVKIFNDFDVNRPTSITGTVSVGSVRMNFTGVVDISDNEGTGLSGKQSVVVLEPKANVTFLRNSGEYGGAMRLVSFATLLILDNSTLSFINNTAYSRGGAMYIDVTAETIIASTGYSDCFIYFRDINIFCQPNDFDNTIPCQNISSTGAKLTFKGNMAPIAGLIYGSTMRCSWSLPLLIKYPNDNMFKILHDHHSDVFTFIPAPYGSDQIATPTLSVVLTSPPDLSAIAAAEETTFVINAYDRFNQNVSDVITARSNDSTIYATISDTNFASLRQKTDTNVSVHLSPNSNESMTGNLIVTLSSLNSPAQVRFNLTLKTCEFGFEYNHTNHSCQCLPALFLAGVECDPVKATLIVPDGYWAGPEKNDSSNIAYLPCYNDYCGLGKVHFQINSVIKDFSSLCTDKYYRDGLGCGSCQEGYSVIFGSNRCKKCSNYYLFLIPLFALLGVLLVVALLFIPIRISEGYITGVLFYCNIITYLNRALYINQTVTTPIVFTIASLISLDLGFEVCFYDGLNELVLASLQFVFPLYLFFLVAVFIIIGQFVNMPSWLGISVPNTLATLFILCYSKIASASFHVLTFTTVNVIDNDATNSSTRWAVAPDLYYFSGFHGALGVISLLLIIFYLIPIPIFLLFPKLTFKFSCILRLKPLLDAVWNPFEPEYRFWLGSRLLFQILIYLISTFAPAPLNLVIVAFFMLLLLYVELILRPYKGSWNIRKCSFDEWLRNEIDCFFIANIVFLVVGVLHFYNATDFTPTHIFVAIVVFTAYLVTIGILIHSIVNAVRRHKKKKERTENLTINHEKKESSPVDEDGITIIKHSSVSVPHVTFSELREPLLDELSIRHPSPDNKQYQQLP